MAYRVIQWATGNVGKHAIRGILSHPQTELAGVYVTSAAKAGRDAGEICGLGRIGIIADDDPKRVLALDADCVVYAPLLPNLDEVCAILASGKNVVTPTGWFYPARQASETLVRLEEACRRGRASLHGTGINPGGASDRFPIMLSALCRNIRHVQIDEYSDIRNYDAREVVEEIMLMGKPPEAAEGSPMLELLGNGFRQSIDMVAAAIEAPIDDYDQQHETAIATREIPTRYGTLARGTVAGQRFTWRGLCGGAPVVTTRVTWVMGWDGLEPRWLIPGEGWVIAFDADPPVRCRLETAWPEAAADPAEQAYRRDHGVIATAMHLVNAIPYVCQAPPGVHTYLDLPMIAGRWSDASA
ncbi:MAG: dihydrodipicolinate reductase [Candidatus Dadabacteria bacterium]|nr:MAG: dihydrodipicolinate reductase [Candidatus Dadabacteria bacterium]